MWWEGRGVLLNTQTTLERCETLERVVLVRLTMNSYSLLNHNVGSSRGYFSQNAVLGRNMCISYGRELIKK